MKPEARKGKVLMVGNFLYAANGIYGICDELAQQLSAHGWEVLTTSSKVRRLPRLLDMVKTAWQRRRDYTIAHVDVFSGAAFFWAEAVCWTLRLAGKPYILTLHGGALPPFAERWPRRVRRLLRSAAAVTTPSRFLLAGMAPYRADLKLCPNPLHVDRYPFRLRSQPQPRLVWLRTFHELYNPSLAVRVVALLRPQVPQIKLIMIGPTRQADTLERVRQLASDLCVEDCVTLNGAVPKDSVGEWLDQGDILLNTTNVDNTPVSVMEAMACGLCVVSTNVGGIPYLVRDGDDGLLVPPGDAEAMAAAVRKVLETPGLGARLSAMARETASRFDWSQMLPEWDALLLSAASR
jgi:glycosyltransferase involved in cell wall biosynthesis